jgi:hypothetical protein
MAQTTAGPMGSGMRRPPEALPAAETNIVATPASSCSNGRVTIAASPLEQLAKGHLDALVENAVPEGRALEYKQTVGTNDAAKREFLADVGLLANATGGDLVIGIAEKGGVATAVPGIDADKADGEIRRLENILRDAVDPRIPGVRMRAVPVADAALALSAAYRAAGRRHIWSRSRAFRVSTPATRLGSTNSTPARSAPPSSLPRVRALL